MILKEKKKGEGKGGGLTCEVHISLILIFQIVVVVVAVVTRYIVFKKDRGGKKGELTFYGSFSGSLCHQPLMMRIKTTIRYWWEKSHDCVEKSTLAAKCLKKSCRKHPETCGSGSLQCMAVTSLNLLSAFLFSVWRFSPGTAKGLPRQVVQSLHSGLVFFSILYIGD